MKTKEKNKMKTLLLRRDYKESAEKLIGEFADPSHGHILDRDDTIVRAPDTGKVTALLLCNVLSPDLTNLLYELCKAVKNQPSNRPNAMATQSLARSVGLDGRPSPRLGVNNIVLDASPARDGTLGYDRPGHRTTLTREHREMLDGNRRLIELMDAHYKRHLPDVYEKQLAALEKSLGRLWRTVFTTGYIAKNFRTAYHRAGNWRGGMTCLTATGDFSGGELVLPRFRIAFALRPGDLLIFDAEQVHGNMPIKGERVSLALYCGRWIVERGK
jgi:hypothetical protein